MEGTNISAEEPDRILPFHSKKSHWWAFLQTISPNLSSREVNLPCGIYLSFSEGTYVLFPDRVSKKMAWVSDTILTF